MRVLNRRSQAKGGRTIISVKKPLNRSLDTSAPNFFRPGLSSKIMSLLLLLFCICAFVALLFWVPKNTQPVSQTTTVNVSDYWFTPGPSRVPSSGLSMHPADPWTGSVMQNKKTGEKFSYNPYPLRLSTELRNGGILFLSVAGQSDLASKTFNIKANQTQWSDNNLVSGSTCIFRIVGKKSDASAPEVLQKGFFIAPQQP